jgi:hypothetical protein
MIFFINMGLINSDFPFINDAKMIYQLPYLYICINGRGLSQICGGNVSNQKLLNITAIAHSITHSRQQQEFKQRTETQGRAHLLALPPFKEANRFDRDRNNALS